MLEMMMPDDLPLDELETLRAKVGLVEVTEKEEFRGGFNEDGVGVSRPPAQQAMLRDKRQAA